MSRVYTAVFSAVSVSATQDLFSIKAITDKPFVLHGFTLSNVGIAADAGDAQEEILSIKVVRGNTTVGSGGGAFTPLPVVTLDTAAASTVRINDTTPVSGGTGSVVFSDGWNTRIPYQMFFLPEHRFPCSAASGQTFVAIQLASTPTDAFLVSGTVWFEEGV